MSANSRATILAASRVITMTPNAGSPTAVSVLGGRVVAVGDLPSLHGQTPNAQVVDLGDAVLMPGFNDAHMHPSMAAEDLLHVDLSPDRVRDRRQLSDTLSAAAASTPRGEWIRASRYDHQATTGGQTLDRADLDAISQDHPMVLVHVGAHWGVVNSAALRAGGISEGATPPRGGEYGRDAAGRLNGVLYEQALFDYVYPAVANGPTVAPESTLEDRLRGLGRFVRLLNSAGVTSACDALGGPSSLRLLQEANDRGLLNLRTGVLLAYPHAKALHDLGMTSGFGGENLRLVGIKAFVDGAVAGRTCLLSQPGDEHHGIQVLDDAELDAIVQAVHRAGSRLAVHANGDLAIAKLLDAVDRAQRAHPRPDARHRVEHCTVVTPELVARLARSGMTAVPFGSYVSFHGAKLLEWYGHELLERMFAHRSLLDAGVRVAGSSDYPCGPYEPLRAIQSCVTRQSSDGTILGRGQRITAAEALALYTTGSAYASGEEHIKGRIAPGYLADFVALGADPLRTAPDRISQIPVLSTWVGGTCVWDAESAAG